MKKSLASTLAAPICLVALIAAGCSSAPEGVHPAYLRNNANNGFNVLGIVEYSPASYQKLYDDNGNVRTKELIDTENVSGDNYSFLWGTVVLADY